MRRLVSAALAAVVSLAATVPARAQETVIEDALACVEDVDNEEITVGRDAEGRVVQQAKMNGAWYHWCVPFVSAASRIEARVTMLQAGPTEPVSFAFGGTRAMEMLVFVSLSRDGWVHVRDHQRTLATVPPDRARAFLRTELGAANDIVVDFSYGALKVSVNGTQVVDTYYPRGFGGFLAFVQAAGSTVRWDRVRITQRAEVLPAATRGIPTGTMRVGSRAAPPPPPPPMRTSAGVVLSSRPHVLYPVSVTASRGTMVVRPPRDTAGRVTFMPAHDGIREMHGIFQAPGRMPVNYRVDAFVTLEPCPDGPGVRRPQVAGVIIGAQVDTVQGRVIRGYTVLAGQTRLGPGPHAFEATSPTLVPREPGDAPWRDQSVPTSFTMRVEVVGTRVDLNVDGVFHTATLAAPPTGHVGVVATGNCGVTFNYVAIQGI